MTEIKIGMWLNSQWYTMKDYKSCNCSVLDCVKRYRTLQIWI